MRLLKYLLDTLNKSNQTKNLGRWREKSNVENWMLNYHPEPGYQNHKKEEWLKNNKNYCSKKIN